VFKLILSLTLIFIGLGLGYTIQKIALNKVVCCRFDLLRLRVLLQEVGILFFMSIAYLGAVWNIQINDLKIITLPLFGLFAPLTGGFLALCAAKFLNLTKKQKGSMYSCGAFTNIGAIGGLVCYLFFGEEGFAFVVMYKLFEELGYFSIGFPIIKFISSEYTNNENKPSRLKYFFRDKFTVIFLLVIIIGSLLNIFGIKRPAFYETVISIFIPIGSLALLTSIGIAMKFDSIKKYVKECIAISFIKFLIMPLILSTVAVFLGYGGIDDSLPLKVVIILSAMPVAFIALIPPTIYDLDVDLANACWLVTTLLLLAILPILYLITNVVMDVL